MNSSQHLKIIRIGLIIAIIAGFGVGALNGWKVRQKIQRLQTSLAEETAARQKAETELAVTKREHGATSAALAQTKTSLQAASDARDRAIASATDQRARAERLANELTASRQQTDTTRAELARYRAPGLQPEQIVKAAELIKKLQKELAVAEADNKKLSRELINDRQLLAGNTSDILLPSGLDGKVLAFDPKWQFVVLNAGEEQGVLKGGELLVNRAGKLVAKVVVARVEKNRCIATVMPGWGLGEIAEGDRAIPAHPGS